MKTLMVCLLSLYIILLTVNEVKKTKNNSGAVREVLKLISSFKTELRFKLTCNDLLFEKVNQEKYKYIAFENNRLFLKNCENNTVKNEFSQFISKIGTTDNDGQISLCDEYLSVFSLLEKDIREKEKSKIKVNTALGMLGAVTVFLFFI